MNFDRLPQLLQRCCTSLDVLLCFLLRDSSLIVVSLGHLLVSSDRQTKQSKADTCVSRECVDWYISFVHCCVGTCILHV